MIYSDLNADTAQNYPLVFDVPSVKQSIASILSTIIGERVFNPTFGSGVQDMVFELIDDISANSILNQIYDSVTRWDPRVQIDFGRSTVIPDIDNYGYKVTIYYSIRGLQDQKFDESFFIQRS